MKTLKFLLFLLLIPFIGNSQPGTARQYSADLYLEPTAFKNNIRIYTYFLNAVDATSCDTVEWGWSLGNNIVLTTTTTFMNMGPEDAVFDNLNPLCDSTQLVYHSCHGHSHVKGFQQFYVKDLCGNIVKQSNKIGFNMGSNFQWPYRFDSFGNIVRSATQSEWDELIKYCIPDSSICNRNYNPYANADTYQVVDVGFGDSYSWSYRGQGVRINGLTDGYYIFGCILDPPHCAINEGNNCYPNVVEVPVLIQGTNVTTVSNPPFTTPQPVYNADANVVGSDVKVTWGVSGDFCKFEVTPIYVQGNTERKLNNRTISVTSNLATFNTSLLYQDARALGNGNGPAKYRFGIVTVNGNQRSAEVKTKQTVNVR